MSWPPIPRDWDGQPAFVIGGGPSAATQRIERLEGRNVIVVNSSYESAPWADILFFGDYRWWCAHKANLIRNFPGRMMTCSHSIQHPRVTKIRNSKPAGRHKDDAPMRLSVSPLTIPMRRTSFAPAINIAFLRGANPIVLLGADGKAAADGTTHHHKPHKWKVRQGCWDVQRKSDLGPLAEDLKAKGVDVLNASPGSAWDMWPIMTLTEALGRL